ncbi:conserved hypothetical protein [Sphingomonas sp. EC-HK361]|uniref:hypothetical protein n=1 Tax=Sphingomonas sp. EC-HK361 TaxID=2038397 RepID=UPI0012535BE9|nr:hypothetical protein [Sphingomonas sp. EC-HK361]VVT07895.1 conserved hypothetical protein [Sphingomonas sp. EC-HK361]
MPAASYLSGSNRERTPLRRRILSLSLAIAAHVLVVLLLLRLAPSLTPPPKGETSLSTFDALPAAAPAEQHAKATTKAQAKRGEPTKTSPKTAPTEPPPPAPPVKAPLLLPGGMELFDAADISKLGSKSDDGARGNADSGKESVAAYGPGEGPGGVRLYNAEWYREPTNAELTGYMPPGGPPIGFGLIACQTVPDFRVENCRALAESPAGSGVARALRLAAWQFRVKPPRVGGKQMIGAWVRIKITFTPGGMSY